VDKQTTGLGCLMVAGIALAIVGFFFTMTLIGAIIGIPMMLIGGAAVGYTFVKMIKKSQGQ
jgi:hypothetical protein